MNSRRSFLQRAALVGGAAISVPLQSLWRRAEAAEADGYGPLRPTADGTTGLDLLELPEGFRYVSFGWAGDPMEGGLKTPALHDGMAAFGGRNGLVTLIRNHEVGPGPCFSTPLAYDRRAAGGTTTLVFDPAAGNLVSARASLSGTVRNCAGGPTPWNSWLTCEETTLGADEDPLLERNHGYVFEVPVEGTPSKEPLRDMGRFVHEAVAVDPESGIVYQTEDRRRAGLYRFIPHTRGRLADGGRLQMLAIQGRPRLDTRTGQESGARYPVRWVDIDDPSRAHVMISTRDDAGVFSQGVEAGGAIFGRLEGAWYADGSVFVTATDGGNARAGQVWELNVREQEIRLVFESPAASVLNMPDNLVVSPRGGLVLCENGSTSPYIHGLTREGRISRFAKNNVRLRGEHNGIQGDFRTREFAGATFSPDGQWMFVNVQIPGITFAITGPWERGSL